MQVNSGLMLTFMEPGPHVYVTVQTYIQVKIFLPRLILNFLGFLILIREKLGLGDKGN